MHRAKDEVKASLRAKGLKLGQFSAREITLLAEGELERNRAQFLAEAEHSINIWPGFARWRLPPEVFEKITETEHSPSASSTNAGLIAND
jgi:hypothetical protein